MNLELHLQIAGLLLLLLAAVNLALPRYFRWNDELQKVSLLTRQVFQVHCSFIILVLLLMGLLSLTLAGELLESTRLSRGLLAGLAVFWGARLFTQWFVYDGALWRGRRLETAVHFAATALWSYLTGVYAWAWAGIS